MRVWQVTHYGEPEEMVLAEVDTPVPSAGQVRIRNHACGFNFFDLLQCQGKYQSKPAFPFTIGAEVSGIVDAVGEGVELVKVGDRVLSPAPRRRLRRMHDRRRITCVPNP